MFGGEIRPGLGVIGGGGCHNFLRGGGGLGCGVVHGGGLGDFCFCRGEFFVGGGLGDGRGFHRGVGFCNLREHCFLLAGDELIESSLVGGGGFALGGGIGLFGCVIPRSGLSRLRGHLGGEIFVERGFDGGVGGDLRFVRGSFGDGRLFEHDGRGGDFGFGRFLLLNDQLIESGLCGDLRFLFRG